MNHMPDHSKNLDKHFKKFIIGKVQNNQITILVHPLMHDFPGVRQWGLNFNCTNDFMSENNIVLFGLPNKLLVNYIWKTHWTHDVSYETEANKIVFKHRQRQRFDVLEKVRFCIDNSWNFDFLCNNDFIIVDIFENIDNISEQEFIESFPKQTTHQYYENYRKRNHSLRPFG